VIAHAIQYRSAESRLVERIRDGAMDAESLAQPSGVHAARQCGVAQRSLELPVYGSLVQQARLLLETL